MAAWLDGEVIVLDDQPKGFGLGAKLETDRKRSSWRRFWGVIRERVQEEEFAPIRPQLTPFCPKGSSDPSLYINKALGSILDIQSLRETSGKIVRDIPKKER